MNKVKGIIFDADGPLYIRDADYKQKEKDLLLRFGWSEDKLEKFKESYESQKEAAYVQEITVNEMFRKIFEENGIEFGNEQLDKFVKDFNIIHSQIVISGNSPNVLQQIKNMGIKICVLTDSFYPEKEKWEWFKSINLDPLIDIIVTSFDIKKLKDSKEAYQICLEKMNLQPNEVIFVGHKQYEMDGAKKADILSVNIQNISEPNIISDYNISVLDELPQLIENTTSI